MPTNPYYQTHKENCRVYNERYYQTHKEYVRNHSRDYHQKIKRQVLSHYSSDTVLHSIACAICGFSDIRALSIDHINGGGEEHRKAMLASGIAFYLWLRKNKYPEGYQVLCMNCQWIKRGINGETRKAIF